MSLLMISTARKLKMMTKNNTKLILLTQKKLMKFICNLILGLTIVSNPLSGYSQKKNITDAAMLMKKYTPMLGLDAGQKIVEEAKVFIDLAAVNPETIEDVKMHFYRAEVYFSLIELASMKAISGNGLNEKLLEEYEAISKESFKKVMADPKKTWKEDADQFINFRSGMAFEMGLKSYNERKFDQATQLFSAAYAIQEFLGTDYKDAAINASLSLNKAVDSLLQKKDFDGALKIAEETHKIIPLNIDVIISIININLQKGDLTNSEKFLTKALAIDPKNKQLYYVLGTSYIDLKENEKAEEALIKAIEIDSNYNEAQYQLGAHLFNWANDLKTSADQLDLNDPKAPLLVQKAEETLNRALVVLEKYILINPTEKAVLEILWKSYYKLGNDVKSAEYKKRAQDIK